MVVYRVEDPKTRLGMYFSNTFAHEVMSTGGQHPEPFSDGRLLDELKGKREQLGSDKQRFTSACKFGFASKKQMRNWISEDEWKQKLAEHGLVVAKYQVPKSQVAIGRTQVIYHPSQAKLVATMSPTKI